MHLSDFVDAFLTHHRAMGNSEATIKHYADSLKLLQRCYMEEGLEDLTTSNMNIFAGWLRTTPTQQWRGKTERSIWGVHGALKDTKAFVRWLVEEEYLVKAPKVPVPKLPQRLYPILSDDELVKIFSSSHLADKTEIAVRNRALISFMLDTGVRLSEAANLTYAHLNLHDHEAVVTGKGNKQRVVYFAPSTAESIKEWVALRGTDEGALFWLAASGIRMLIARIRRDLELPLFTAYQIRHTAFTMMVKHGMDLHTIKRIAGHASVTTTESYLALAGVDMRAKHLTASPMEHVSGRMSPKQEGRRRLKSA